MFFSCMLVATYIKCICLYESCMYIYENLCMFLYIWLVSVTMSYEFCYEYYTIIVMCHFLSFVHFTFTVFPLLLINLNSLTCIYKDIYQ